MIDLDDIVLHRRSDVAGRSLDGDLVLLSAQARQIHALNDSAAAIWDAIGAACGMEGLIEHLKGRFDVDESVLRNDVERVLEELDDRGLLGGHREREPASVRDTPGPWQSKAARYSFELGPFRALESVIRVAATTNTTGDEAAQLFAELAQVLEPLIFVSVDLDLTERLEPTTTVHLEIEHDSCNNDASNPAARRWTVRRNGTTVALLATAATVREAVLAEVNAAAIASLAESVGFHAGAVEFPAGVVIFPGVSDAGKSTLVANLMQRGHRYLTDEAAAVNVHTHEVSLFAKSVCVDHGAHALFAHLCPPEQHSWATWHVDPNHIGTGSLGTPGPPAAVVFPVYEADAPLSLTVLSRSEAVERLLENSFDFAKTGRKGAELILALSDAVPCFELRHGGQREHLDVLEAQFGCVGD